LSIAQILENEERRWNDLVEQGWHLSEQSLAQLNGNDGLKRKLAAIRHARMNGVSREQVAAQQHETMSAFIRAKKRYGPERIVRWRIDAGLADAIQSKVASPDQEESLQQRLIRVCDIRYSNELWEFILSCFADLSDAQLRNLAGVVKKRKKTE
jgi:hypothetical protein